jgi:thiol-disulfide isomerase/thioredoxin
MYEVVGPIPVSLLFNNMKKILVAIAAVSLLFPSQRGFAADNPSAATELKEIVAKVQAKLKDGKKTEADLASELKEFDAVLARHKNEKTDDVAQILFMKAMLYMEVFDNTDKGVALVQQLKNDYPDTQTGKNADKILEQIKQQAEAKKLQDSLVAGVRFPDFDEKDVAGQPLSIASYKGKVVMLDFWATWCGPCVGELPNVLKTYEKHHADGFDIIGISLDKDKEKLTSFTKEKKMPWRQFFDGLVWQNKLAVRYGVTSIPATYLLDGEGKIIAKDLRGDALEAAVAKALPKK